MRTLTFQSTLPARGATYYDTPEKVERWISIHAPRTGSDKPRNGVVLRQQIFQSTLPARGATYTAVALHLERKISIHAPRTGSDADAVLLEKRLGISIHAPRTGSDALFRWFLQNVKLHFNPRSPHGERPSSPM